MSIMPSLRTTLMITMSSLVLAGCGSADSGYNQKAQAPMPPIKEMDAAMAKPAPMPMASTMSSSDTLTPVAANPALSTQQALAPASAASADERIAQLEQQVSSLQADYQRIMPAFASLNTTNERIQTLLDELETNGKIPPAAKTAMVAPKAEPAKPAMVVAASEEGQALMAQDAAQPDEAAAKVAPAAAPSQMPQATAAIAADNAVTSVRIGEHGSKTRVVFDLASGKKPVFTYDLDNAEKLLMVEMPSASWSGKDFGKPNSPLIAGWNSQKSASGGSAVAIQLKKDARVLSTEFLKAEGKDPARLVMDIASGS